MWGREGSYLEGREERYWRMSGNGLRRREKIQHIYQEWLHEGFQGLNWMVPYWRGLPFTILHLK